jgi:hypothetical protein
MIEVDAHWTCRRRENPDSVVAKADGDTLDAFDQKVHRFGPNL